MTPLTGLRVLISRALDLLLKRRRDERLEEEVRTHLDLLAEELRGRGLSPAEARAAARRAFGGIDQMMEAHRDERGLPFVESVVQDVRLSLRLVRRHPGFAATVLSVLAIGIGVNNMLFTVLNAHTLRGLPIHRVDRVMYISTFDDRVPDQGLSHADFEDLRRGVTSFAGLAAFTGAPVTVTADDRPAERLDAAFISSQAFPLLGAEPLVGGGFSVEHDRPGSAPVVMLGAGVWRAIHGGDPAIVGRTIRVNGIPATVVGVMPDRSGFPSSAQMWLPLGQAPGLDRERRDARTLRVFGRVRDGVAVQAARAEVESVAARVARLHPDTSRNLRARVTPINDRFLGRLTDPAWLAFTMVGILVVLISCANVANLMLGRALQRAREIAIRTSLGAGRGRLVRQLCVEGCVFAILGGVGGLAVAAAGIRIFRSAIPENILPYWFDYSVDWRVLVALVAVSLATVFVFALVPAVHASRTDVNDVMKGGGHPGRGRRGTRRWTTGFLAAEFALAVVLLSQLVAAFQHPRLDLPSDLAVDTTAVITAAINLPPEPYRTAERRLGFYQRLEERLSGLPDVRGMAVASVLPLTGPPQSEVGLAGGVSPDRGEQRRAGIVAISPGYYDTLGLRLLAGRDFTPEDGIPGLEHAIVNERFVQVFLDGRNPVGERISVNLPGPPPSEVTPLTIVGVSFDIRQRPTPAAEPIVYVPYRAIPLAEATLLVRGEADARGLIALLREEVRSLDPNLPLYRVRTLAQATRDAAWNGRVAQRLVLVLTGIAVGLAALGLYAVAAHVVSERTREIGVRMALGARPGQVVRLVLRDALRPLAGGFAAGVALTSVWERLFVGARADASALHPHSLLALAAVVAAIATMACIVPARRATRLDPVAAIRHE